MTASACFGFYQIYELILPLSAGQVKFFKYLVYTTRIPLQHYIMTYYVLLVTIIDCKLKTFAFESATDKLN